MPVASTGQIGTQPLSLLPLRAAHFAGAVQDEREERR